DRAARDGARRATPANDDPALLVVRDGAVGDGGVTHLADGLGARAADLDAEAGLEAEGRGVLSDVGDGGPGHVRRRPADHQEADVNGRVGSLDGQVAHVDRRGAADFHQDIQVEAVGGECGRGLDDGAGAVALYRQALADPDLFDVRRRVDQEGVAVHDGGGV